MMQSIGTDVVAGALVQHHGEPEPEARANSRNLGVAYMQNTPYERPKLIITYPCNARMLIV